MNTIAQKTTARLIQIINTQEYFCKDLVKEAKKELKNRTINI